MGATQRWHAGSTPIPIHKGRSKIIRRRSQLGDYPTEEVKTQQRGEQQTAAVFEMHRLRHQNPSREEGTEN
jgi:hypothetical protein